MLTLRKANKQDTSEVLNLFTVLLCHDDHLLSLEGCFVLFGSREVLSFPSEDCNKVLLCWEEPLLGRTEQLCNGDTGA